MSFANLNQFTAAAEQHQNELIRQAAEARLVRRAAQRRLDYWRRPPRSS